MKFDHMVKYNGKYYEAGEDVPLWDDKKEVSEETPPSSPASGKQYSKSEINRMTTAELQALATEKGIDGAYSMTGGDLKKLLIEMLVG